MVDPLDDGVVTLLIVFEVFPIIVVQRVTGVHIGAVLDRRDDHITRVAVDEDRGAIGSRQGFDEGWFAVDVAVADIAMFLKTPKPIINFSPAPYLLLAA